MSQYVNDAFKNNIKQWIEYDNKIYQLNKSLKEIRNTRTQIGQEITKHIEVHNLIKTKFNLGDGYIKYSRTNYSNPLTFKFIFECLKQFFNDEELAGNVCKFIKENRTKTENVSLKRTYDLIKAYL